MQVATRCQCDHVTDLCRPVDDVIDEHVKLVVHDVVVLEASSFIQ